jgi:very-short-patch-repair endonuclease
MRKRLKPGTIPRARQLRGDRTDMEGLLWWKLREWNDRGYHFRRQVPVRGYFLDFAEHSARLAIELDGSQHGLSENTTHDAIRDRALKEEGYLTMRFCNDEVRRDLLGIVEAILREVDNRRPPTRIASYADAMNLSDLPTRGR